MTRRPLFHFMVLGALLYAAKTLLPAAEPIVVSAVQVEDLRAQWLAETRRPPGPGELDALIRRFAEEEMLLREALRLGLDRSDPVVRSRLVQNLRFARGLQWGQTLLKPSIASDPIENALFAEALALGMAQRDLVTRRRLVQAMEERYAAAAAVTPGEVASYIAAHPQRYGAQRRVSFEQVFTANDPHATALLPGARVSGQTQAELARVFGASFAQAVMQAPAGQWVGPIRSAYGTHRVRITAVSEADAAAPSAQRQAWYALLEEHERAAVQEALEGLRRAYPLAVESAS